MFVVALSIGPLARGAGTPAVLNETFDAPSALATGWTARNHSTPVGESSWAHGPFTAAVPDGMDRNFAAVEYLSAGQSASGGPATADNWLLSRSVVLRNGDVVAFDTRSGYTPPPTPVEGDMVFPDRLQVWFVPDDSRGLAALSDAAAADGFVRLLDINPNYAADGFPFAWSRFEATVTGLPGEATGCIGFRYFVEDSGPAGTRGHEVWIDNVVVTPEPAGAGLALATIACAGARRRRRPLAG